MPPWQVLLLRASDYHELYHGLSRAALDDGNITLSCRVESVPSNVLGPGSP